MKKAIAIFCISISLLLCVTISPAFAATKDEAIISGQEEDYEPLYTLPPESAQSSDINAETSRRDYALFYTQTTFLALLAGYLILFKIKGINHGEKMHKRRNSK